MVYLAVKELSTAAEDVIMVTSSIMKDMQPNLEVIYRPNAIRALCQIIDVSLFIAVTKSQLIICNCFCRIAFDGARGRTILQGRYCG
jgi:hypothetical protein